MPAGNLRTRLVIEVNEPIHDGAGQLLENWKKLRSELFAIEPLSADEAPRGAQNEATATLRLRCRYFVGANSRMRLRAGTRIFLVAGVVNVQERNRWLEWTAREVVS